MVSFVTNCEGGDEVSELFCSVTDFIRNVSVIAIRLRWSLDPTQFVYLCFLHFSETLL